MTRRLQNNEGAGFVEHASKKALKHVVGVYFLVRYSIPLCTKTDQIKLKHLEKTGVLANPLRVPIRQGGGLVVISYVVEPALFQPCDRSRLPEYAAKCCKSILRKEDSQLQRFTEFLASFFAVDYASAQSMVRAREAQLRFLTRRSKEGPEKRHQDRRLHLLRSPVAGMERGPRAIELGHTC